MTGYYSSRVASNRHNFCMIDALQSYKFQRNMLRMHSIVAARGETPLLEEQALLTMRNMAA